MSSLGDLETGARGLSAEMAGASRTRLKASCNSLRGRYVDGGVSAVTGLRGDGKPMIGEAQWRSGSAWPVGHR
jgi:hypothetical protein